MTKIFSYFAPSKEVSSDSMLHDERRRWCIKRLEEDINRFVGDKKGVTVAFSQTFDQAREGLQFTAIVSTE